MKKTLSTLLLVSLVLVMTLSLVACSSIKTIENNFVNEGYKVLDTADGEGALLSFVADLGEDGSVSCTPHIYKKSIGNYAVVLEFGADDQAKAKLQEYLTDEDVENYLEADKQSAYLRGNCVLIPVSLSSTTRTEMLNTFNK